MYITYIFLCQIQQMVLGVEHVVLVAGDDDDALIAVLGEADVHLELVHDTSDILPLETNKPSMYARVDINFITVLVVLKKLNLL